MPRIAGINIPENKKIDVSLTYIFGIGRSLSSKILAAAQINSSLKASELTSQQTRRLREIIETKHKVGGELKREIITNIRRLKDINSWKGARHSKGLPVRGQRTKTNSRTVRGNVRRTVGSGKRRPPSPK